MSQMSDAVRSRLIESPVALRAHVALIVAAALVAPDHGAAMWWAAPVIVGMVSWALLRGSFFAWWVQLVGILISLIGLFGVLQRVVEGLPGLSVFVPPATLALVTVMLLGGLFLLFLPSVRGYCRDSTGAPRRAAGFALAAIFVGMFPGMSLSLEPRLPSRSNSLERTANAQYVGTDPAGPSVFYVGGEHDETCLVVLEPRSSSRGCWHHGLELEHVHGTRTANVHAWALPKRVVRVTSVYGSGPSREALLLTTPAASANLFYVTESLDDLIGIRAYDASGRRIVDCRWC